MLRELNMSEMDMVAGGNAGDEIITTQERIVPDAPSGYEPNIGGHGGAGLSHGGLGVYGHLGGGRHGGSSSNPTPADNEDSNDDQDNTRCVASSIAYGVVVTAGLAGLRAGNTGRPLLAIPEIGPLLYAGAVVGYSGQQTRRALPAIVIAAGLACSAG